MNTPNKLTLLRIIMTPFFMASLLIEFPHHQLVALILFSIAAITDHIDGEMARKNNLITDFGKFLDPLADKMLTTAAFLCFVDKGWGWGITWITFIVLFREFFITSLRLVSLGSGKVVAANIWGKLKTVSQMVSIIMVITFEYAASVFSFPPLVSGILRGLYSGCLWFSAIMAVVSGVIYFWDNKSFINPKK